MASTKWKGGMLARPSQERFAVAVCYVGWVCIYHDTLLRVSSSSSIRSSTSYFNSMNVKESEWWDFLWSGLFDDT